MPVSHIATIPDSKRHRKLFSTVVRKPHEFNMKPNWMADIETSIHCVKHLSNKYNQREEKEKIEIEINHRQTYGNNNNLFDFRHQKAAMFVVNKTNLWLFYECCRMPAVALQLGMWLQVVWSSLPLSSPLAPFFSYNNPCVCTTDLLCRIDSAN